MIAGVGIDGLWEGKWSLGDLVGEEVEDDERRDESSVIMVFFIYIDIEVRTV